MQQNSIKERDSKSQKSSFSFEIPQDMEDQLIEATPKVSIAQSFPKKNQMENIQENYEEFQTSKVKHLFTQKQNQQDNQQTTCRFISLMRTDKFIERFKNNLLMNSYIMPQHLIHKLRSKYPKDFKKNKIKQSVHSKTELLLFKIDSKFLMIWDVISTIANLFIMWNTPYYISFGQDDQYSVIKLIETVILVILTLTMFVNMNRAIIIEGQEITNRQIIIKKYVQTQFLFDLIIPILLFVPRNFILELLGLFKIMAAYQNLQNYFVHKLELTYFQGNTQGNVLDLIIMIFQICFYNHLMACIFHFVGRNTEYLGKTWITERGLQDESPSNRYVYAFYWATMTMTTVGYGDITAQNEIETLVSSIIMLTSTCVFAYSMNSIGIILKDIYDSKIKEKLLLLSINAYMKKNQVDFRLQNRIRNYIQYFAYQLNKKNEEDSQSIIQQLPLSLKEELQNDISEKIINKQEWLISHFSLSTQRDLSKNLELIKIIPGDYVIRQGDQTNLDLYFIQDGEVQVLEEQTQMKFGKLSKNSTVGQVSFFTGQPSKATVKSTTYTELYKISRNDFLKIIESNRKDFEIYHYIKDQLIFNNQYNLIDSKCEICQMHNHQEIDCPYIQYKPDLEQRLKKSMFKSSINLRKPFKRKIHQKAEYNLELIRSSVKIFQQDRGEDELSLTQIGPSQIRVSDSGQYEENIQNIRKGQPKVSIITNTNLLKQVVEITYFGYSMTLDKIANFKNYYPYNNIRKITSVQQNTIHNLENYSKYTFKYFVKQAASKFYQKLRKQRKIPNIQIEQL